MKSAIGTLVVLGIISLSFPTFAQDTGYTINFDSAHVLGTKESLIAHRVPVKNLATGDVVLQDVSIRFSVDLNGQLVLEEFMVMPSSSQLSSADNFLPGTYADGENNCYVVTGGGTSFNGRPTGSVRSKTSGVKFTAGWIGGLVENHPSLAGLENADQFQDGYSYGSVGDNTIPGFCNGGIVGALQTGTGLAINAFHAPGCSFGECCTNPNDNPTTTFARSNLSLSLVADESECNIDEQPAQ